MNTVKPLRVLLVEDSENDATLLELALQRTGFSTQCERVETAEGPDERFLGQILGFLPIADHPPDETQNLSPVVFQKLLVGALVVGQASPDQIRIIVTLL